MLRADDIEPRHRQIARHRVARLADLAGDILMRCQVVALRLIGRCGGGLRQIGALYGGLRHEVVIEPASEVGSQCVALVGRRSILPVRCQTEQRAAACGCGGISTTRRHERIGIDARGEFQSVRRRIPAYRAAAYLDAAREISRPRIQTLPSEARRAEIRAAGSARFHLSRRDGKVGIGQRETLAPRHDGQIPACRCGQIIRRRTRKLQMLHSSSGANSQTLHRCLVQHLIARGVHQRDAVRARAICRQRVAAGVLAYVYRLIAVVARGYLQITAIRGRAVAENRPLVIPGHRPLDSRRHRHARRRTLRAIARIPERQHTRHRVARLADLVGQQAVSRSLSVGVRDAVARQRRRLPRRDLAPVQRGDVIRRENLARYGCHVPQGVDRDGRQHASRRGVDCLVGSACRMGVVMQTPDRRLKVEQLIVQFLSERGPESVVSPGSQLPVAVKPVQRPSATARRVIRATSRDEIDGIETLRHLYTVKIAPVRRTSIVLFRHEHTL